MFKHVSLWSQDRKEVTYKPRKASMFINMLEHSSTMRLAANSAGWVRGRTLSRLFMLLRIKRKIDKEAKRKMAPAFPHHFLLTARCLPQWVCFYSRACWGGLLGFLHVLWYGARNTKCFIGTV